MAIVTYQDKEYDIPKNASVLEALEAAGVDISSSCRNGVCQTCKMKATSGKLPAKAQEGLRLTEQEMGYFLPCVCYPTEDIVITNNDTISRYTVSVLSVTPLNDEIIEIKLTHPEGFSYRSGQFIQLFKDPQHVRTYSLASVPGKNEPLTLQVRVIPGGLISPWLQTLSSGDEVSIAGPLGDCFYTNDRKDQPIVMIGTGSGLSPLYGILHDALLQNHEADIYLFHGVVEKKSLYKETELRMLSEKFPQFQYFPCLSNEKTDLHEYGMVLDVALKKSPTLKGARVFLCGHPEMVKTGRKKIFIAGAAMDDIYADPFG
ncbi:MAG: 2Fe-2S iron-sulfur cluster-binding protein [Gammaproteobacteria bacterium]